MNKYKFLYLFWLLPAFFLALGLQQTAVYYGLQSTYQNGDSYIAEVLEYHIEQRAAQRNGHVTIRFTTDAHKTVKLQLTASGKIVAHISKLRMVPIRYKKDAFVEAVFMPTIELQRGLVLSNMALAGVAFLIAFFIGFIAHRKAQKLSKQGPKKELVIERVDEETYQQT